MLQTGKRAAGKAHHGQMNEQSNSLLFKQATKLVKQTCSKRKSEVAKDTTGSLLALQQKQKATKLCDSSWKSIRIQPAHKKTRNSSEIISGSLRCCMTSSD